METVVLIIIAILAIGFISTILQMLVAILAAIVPHIGSLLMICLIFFLVASLL